MNKFTEGTCVCVCVCLVCVCLFVCLWVSAVASVLCHDVDDDNTSINLSTINSLSFSTVDKPRILPNQPAVDKTIV